MKNAVSKDTARLLRKVQKRILAEPRQFVMWSYFTSSIPNTPNCGTAACIAGWTIAESQKLNPQQANNFVQDHGYDDHELAKKRLGITHRQANHLFYDESWPAPFRDQYRKLPHNQRMRRARVAVARIEHFIKTGE